MAKIQRYDSGSKKSHCFPAVSIAQLEERQLYIQKIVGSTPSLDMIFSLWFRTYTKKLIKSWNKSKD